jgi:HD-GYP domain-containing protein (c-di-GMP phosphodiesterase class II)
MHKRAQIQNSRSLRIVAESSALKAGLQLLMTDQASREARLTVEDQLREICEITGVDLLLVSSVEGRPLVGVRRSVNTLASMDTAQVHEPVQDFFLEDGYAYRITSVPINQAEDNIALLSVGEHFDLSDFSAPVVLVGNGNVLKSSLAGHSLKEIESGLNHCGRVSECEVKLGNEVYLSLIVDTVQFGKTYSLRSLQNLDQAINPVQHVLRQTFLTVGIGALLAAILISAFSARSIVRPLAHLIWQLRQSGRSGLLPEVNTGRSAVREIRELTAGFNDAAVAIRQGREELNRAYIEFIGSLANALDARDPYTAGHSFRVSEYSCAIAESLSLPAGEIEQIRIGAMLHDIGKIGISDNVLQKPGRLTDEEFALIKEHPVIGRKILEGVHGLAAYLPTVELHHENWDGTGYPFGLSEEKVPLAARIVHVADAYDAMTSDRPYRRGMSSDEAVRALEKNAGTQFDPLLVSILAQCVANGEGLCAGDSTADSLQKLAVAIQSEGSQSIRQVVVGERA